MSKKGIMKTIIHKSADRGQANHGWLNAKHSFSFANYYNPEKMNFGVLRVLNDDIVAGGMGFGTHPHNNMEIITIPLQGALAHKDSMGNGTTIFAGDVQVMSAGTGIQHSEFNANEDEVCNLLQIWLFPNKKNVEPRYQQITLDVEAMQNNFLQILSPNPEDEGVWIHQNAWFFMGNFDDSQKTSYKLKAKENGVYLFVISGEIKLNETVLEQRDAIAVFDCEEFQIEIIQDAKILIMDIPLEIN